MHSVAHLQLLGIRGARISVPDAEGQSRASLGFLREESKQMCRAHGRDENQKGLWELNCTNRTN